MTKIQTFVFLSFGLKKSVILDRFIFHLLMASMIDKSHCEGDQKVCCCIDSELLTGQVKTAPDLSDRASENDSVICSIPEEQND